MKKELIEEAINNSFSMFEASKKIGISKWHFEKFAKLYGLWKPNRGAKGRPGKKKEDGHGKISLSEILDGLHPYYKRVHLKKRLIDEGIKQNKCEECQIDKWQGKPLSCHLDHKNGINNDHRLINLRMLCPNCHSQTDTYGIKNRKKW